MNKCPDCRMIFEEIPALLDHIENIHHKPVDIKSEKKRRNKYNNKKVEIDGFIFDSVGEGNRYIELKQLEKSGDICQLKLQPRYKILDGFESSYIDQGEKIEKRERPIYYQADFEYLEKGFPLAIVEEFKGAETATFKLKRKMFLQKYGDRFDYRISR